MIRLNPRFVRSWQLQVISAFLTSALSGLLVNSVTAQVAYPTAAGDQLLFESDGASRISEKVRAKSQGVMMAIFVKPGDAVRKGQLLGQTELDNTKLQLDLAKHALQSKANVNAAKSQAEAWSATREETEEAVRRRKMESTRLDWASAMEKMYQANYEAQLDAETTQQIQYDYWKNQYEKCFFRSPVDGVVSEVLVDAGKSINVASHLFTISNAGAYALPVEVPAAVAAAAVPGKTVPVRAADGKSVCHALVDSVSDTPAANGNKVVRLLVQLSDLPVPVRSKLGGMKFEVLLPSADAAK